MRSDCFTRLNPCNLLNEPRLSLFRNFHVTPSIISAARTWPWLLVCINYFMELIFGLDIKAGKPVWISRCGTRTDCDGVLVEGTVVFDVRAGRYDDIYIDILSNQWNDWIMIQYETAELQEFYHYYYYFFKSLNLFLMKLSQCCSLYDFFSKYSLNIYLHSKVAASTWTRRSFKMWKAEFESVFIVKVSQCIRFVFFFVFFFLV